MGLSGGCAVMCDTKLCCCRWDQRALSRTRAGRSCGLYFLLSARSARRGATEMSTIVAASLVAWLTAAAAASCDHGHSGPPPSPPARPLPLRRPPAAQRTFHSAEVERQLEAMLNRSWLDSELRTLFHNCMPNTLDTTVWQAPTAADPSLTTFISTGDIAAMWLRDSQNQVRLGLGSGLGLELG